MSLNREAIKKLSRWQRDPVAFVVDNFKVDPDDWQLEGLNALVNNQRLAMKACKGPGKTAFLSWACWWFLATKPHPKIAATSISADNLSDGLWAEMAKWQNKSEFLLSQFEWTKTRIVCKSSPETWFMSARSWSKAADTGQQANTLAGLHADFMMFVIDEAGGVPDSVMAAAEAGLANDTDDGRKQAKLLIAGNPTHLDGPLYRACNQERKLWYVIEITADPDDPHRAKLVSKKWAEEQIQKYGRDNPWVLVNVFGKFPPASINSIIGVDEVVAAMNRRPDPDQYLWSQKRLGIDVARFGDDRCFDDKTEILTHKGWKLFQDLDGSEKVLSVGANEEKAVWGDILHIHKAYFEGELNVYEKRHLNFAITDNHRMLIRANPKSKKYKFAPFKDLPGEFTVRENNGWAGVNPEYKEFTMVKEMPHGGYHKKVYKFDFNDWAEFLGWFVSEGNVYVSKRRKRELRVIITQNPGEKMESIKRLLTRMGLGWRLCPNGKQVEFASLPIGDYLREHCGILACNKKIPYEIKNGSEQAIKKFLDAFLLGDGSCKKNGGGRTYRTSSKQLADDIQEVLAKLGRAGSIKRGSVKGTKFYIDGREITRRNDTYNVYERSTFTGKCVKKREVKKQKYIGFVWCVATQKESIYVRRNGVPMWSGNTVIFPRQGLMSFKPVEMRGMRTTDIAARVMQAKVKWDSEMEFIDDTGHWGHGVIDNLITAGYSPQGIQFHAPALDPRYKNRRAEMWLSMAEWVRRGGSLPNIPEIVGEMSTPTYTFSNGKFLLEDKDQVKARLGRSPDLCDALALTFAIPDQPARDSVQHILERAKNSNASEYDPFKGL